MSAATFEAMKRLYRFGQCNSSHYAVYEFRRIKSQRGNCVGPIPVNFIGAHIGEDYLWNRRVASNRGGVPTAVTSKSS